MITSPLQIRGQMVKHTSTGTPRMVASVVCHEATKRISEWLVQQPKDFRKVQRFVFTQFPNVSSRTKLVAIIALSNQVSLNGGRKSNEACACKRCMGSLEDDCDYRRNGFGLWNRFVFLLRAARRWTLLAVTARESTTWCAVRWCSWSITTG